MRIGIVGNGVVGNATAQVYKPFHEVRIWDCIPERCPNQFADVLNCELVFVCIPETEIEKWFDRVAVQCSSANFVIRSTCPIGTTRKIANRHRVSVCHSPEFLTERTAIVDAWTPTQLVIGSTCYHEGSSLGSDRAASALHGLYTGRFPGVPLRCMDCDESEALKLFINGFFAVKVAYFNEINLLCAKLGLQWGTVLNAILGDGRITHSHTQVPGPDGMYGFGGKCLPKDLDQLTTLMLNNGVQGNGWLVTGSAAARNLSDRERK